MSIKLIVTVLLCAFQLIDSLHAQEVAQHVLRHLPDIRLVDLDTFQVLIVTDGVSSQASHRPVSHAALTNVLEQSLHHHVIRAFFSTEFALLL